MTQQDRQLQNITDQVKNLSISASCVPAVGGQVLVDGEGPVGGDGVQGLGARLLVEQALGDVVVPLRAVAGGPHTDWAVVSKRCDIGCVILHKYVVGQLDPAIASFEKFWVYMRGSKAHGTYCC